MKKNIILAILAIFVLSGCIGGDSSEKNWTALIYPDKSNTKRSKKHGIYPTLDECKKAAVTELTELDLLTRGDYKCGLNCSYHEGMKVDICEQMSK